ncbi:dTDP-4-dehydrorhamnose 3,5-epimerase [Brevundimonas sp.]|uniref:dTDP-4-dehydrorhamnose 3,5-epimerase n=1 Tax=Brevundimonas sp. TaxID=1871086 RepID=UPI002FDA9681
MSLGVTLIRARRFADGRGWFEESFSSARLAALGLDHDFVQDNLSLSRAPGTVRGLHFQRPPHAQAKLVRCVTGAVQDVVVDLRDGSPTLGQALMIRLDAETGDQLYVPAGFAHGFITLSADTRVAYKVSAPYAPQAEGGLAWNDPALGLDGFQVDGAVLSDRDRAWPSLAQVGAPFAYDGRPMALETAS